MAMLHRYANNASKKKYNYVPLAGIEPAIFGLQDQRLATWPKGL